MGRSSHLGSQYHAWDEYFHYSAKTSRVPNTVLAFSTGLINCKEKDELEFISGPIFAALHWFRLW